MHPRQVKKRTAFESAKQKISEDVQKKLRQQIPTDDPTVRRKLREHGHPVCLFGEGPGERRDRLRGVMTGKGDEMLRTGAAGKREDDSSHELFFTVGSEDLQKARFNIAKDSIQRAAERLKFERKEELELQMGEASEETLRWVQTSITTELSQVGDERPLTQGKFSPDGAVFATTGWSGNVQLWALPSGKKIRSLCPSKGEIICHGICFQNSASSYSNVNCNLEGRGSPKEPEAKRVKTEDLLEDTAAANYILASAMADGKILLYKTGSADTPVAEISAHEQRVNRVQFHPMDCYLASTGHDNTWRLFDTETQKELLLQEGHSSPTYGIAFHPDGSLVCTTDIGGIVRLWDTRTGRSLIPLNGHTDQVLSCDFHPMGYQVATASGDNTVRIWDLRKRKCVTTLPAHSKCISQVKYDHTGQFLFSSSYDKAIKIWSNHNYQCKKVLTGHEARIMGADICPKLVNGQYWIGSVAFDRTFKFWGTNS